jgi:hypothetical protein
MPSARPKRALYPSHVFCLLYECFGLRGYLYGIIDRMIAAFALDAMVDLRSPRLRLGDFEANRWLLYALPRLTLPVAVSVNLFFEALCVFILGIEIDLRLSCLILYFLLLYGGRRFGI